MDLDTALTGKPAEGASATDILRADHDEVRRLFTQFRKAAGDAHAQRVTAQSICLQVELHDTIERDVFYPAIRELDAAWASHALEAHDRIANAVERVRSRADAAQALDEPVTKLAGLVEEHVREEEDQIFPKVEAQRAGSLRDLGRALIERKEELTRSTESFEGPAT
jgi:hemerythrin superfamily protein